MSVGKSTSADGHTLKLAINERFDFQVYNELRKAYEDDGKKYDEYVVDLAATTYMDSSALGMLLHLKDYAGGNKASVRIVNAKQGIRDILAVANFDKLVTVE